MNKSKCAERRGFFSSGEGEKTPQYFVYCKFLRRSRTGKEPPSCVRGFVQRLLYPASTSARITPEAERRRSSSSSLLVRPSSPEAEMTTSAAPSEGML